MAWPFARRDAQITPADLLGWRTAKRSGLGGRNVSREQALRNSVVWACLRLRADLISAMPIDVYRRVDGIQVQVPKPPVLVMPDGDRVDMQEWMYSTQFDLDSCGNDLGLITARNGLGLPSRIDLVPLSDWVCEVRKGVIKYRVAGVETPAKNVWHERQYTSSGIPVGLSPIAYAAWSLSTGLSAQEFAAEWFDGGGMPRAQLKNSARKLAADEAQNAKDRFNASVANGDVFVTGKDWDYNPVGAKASESAFLDQVGATNADACRYLGVPGDMVDVATQGSASINYANITQRNLQLLIMHLGPAVSRREHALRKLVAGPRFVKLNADSLLRMDLKSRYEAHGTAINNRFLAPSEVRALEDRPPFTPEQEAEFGRLFGQSKAATAPSTTGAS